MYRFAVLGLLLSLIVSPAGAEPRYFAALAGIISPMLEYHPRGEIDAKVAAGLPHYRVHYDNLGRLAEIAYYRRGRASDHSYFYAHRVRYSYGRDQRVREYFGADGKPKAMQRHYYRSENVQREEFTTAGQRVELRLFGIDGERVEVGTGSYSFIADHTDKRGFIQTQLRKDGSPNIIFDYLPFEVALITLDDNGYLYQILNVANANHTVANHPVAEFAEMRLHFDAYGNERGWEFRDQHGGLINRPETIVDPGYARWLFESDWTNLPLGHYRSYIERYETADGKRFCAGQRCVIRRAFDRRDNMTEERVLGPNGQPAVDPDVGYARVKIDYDELDRRSEMRIYAADGELRRGKVAIRRFRYPADGQPQVDELDHQGQPMPEVDQRT